MKRTVKRNVVWLVLEYVEPGEVMRGVYMTRAEALCSAGDRRMVMAEVAWKPLIARELTSNSCRLNEEP